MNTNEKRSTVPNADADIDRLIRLAGRRDEASAMARARARAVTHQVWRETVERRSRRRWTWFALPLAAAATVILAVFLVRPADDRTASADVAVATLLRGSISVDGRSSGADRAGVTGETLRSGAVIRTASGEFATLALAGGGELRLNGGTTVKFTSARWFEIAAGQLFVDSGHTSGSTLEIDTPGGTIRDVGTRFDVRVDGRDLRVRVRAGAVRLAVGPRHLDAIAGQQLVARSGETAVVEPAQLYGSDWDWLLAAAPFRVEGVTLEAFLRWVESESGRRVEFSDPSLRPALARTVLHGSIDNHTLEDALAVILPACGLSYRFDGDRIIISADRRSR
jgi:ferric-dicitrate binding protein FerR (iron transport regulator)